MRMIAAVVVAMIASSCFAQDMPKPGPEHEFLKKREGVWTTSMKFGGQESKGSITYKMELGGMWLVGTMESEMFGQKFAGKSLETYDPAKKKFVSLWIDSMSTGPVTMEGPYDKDKKTMTTVGEGPGENGKLSKYKSVSEMPDEDTIIMSMFMGDVKEASFVVTYKRKK